MKLSVSIAALAVLGALGCDTEDATMVVADNDYPAVAEGGDAAQGVTVYKVWWVTSLMPDPVAPGAEGQPQRTVPNSDYAYAVLAPGWDPTSSNPPTVLLPVKSAGALSVARGDTLHVRVSDDAFVGNCAAGKPLSQDDADFITQRIFPGEFAGVAFDAKSCTSTPATSDAGADSGGDAAGEASADAAAASDASRGD